MDTDVISYLFKSHPLAIAYEAILAGRSLAASVITVAEIEYGMEAKSWGSARRDLMHRFLNRFTIVSPDEETARLWAQVKRGCERVGRPITFADAWIAASALQLGMPLATHNVRDYSAVGKLTILSASSE